MADIIFSRASVRRFADVVVSDAQVEGLLRAAMAAPSAGNQQPWEFYVVRDAELRGRLAGASRFAGPAGEAPVVIVACSRVEGVKFPENVPQDMGACMENLLLEAVQLGLGAVWLGIAPVAERMDAVAAALDIPATLQPFALAAVGVPAENVVAHGAERFDEARIHRVG